MESVSVVASVPRPECSFFPNSRTRHLPEQGGKGRHRAEAYLVIEDALSGIAVAKAAKMRVTARPDTRFVDPRDYEKSMSVL